MDRRAAEDEVLLPAFDTRGRTGCSKLYCCRPLHRLWYPEEDKKPGQDLFIAAMSIVYDMPIATLNHGDFEQINKFHSLPGVYNPNRQSWAVPRSRKAASTQTADAPMSRGHRDNTANRDYLSETVRTRNSFCQPRVRIVLAQMRFATS